MLLLRSFQEILYFLRFCSGCAEIIIKSINLQVLSHSFILPTHNSWVGILIFVSGKERSILLLLVGAKSGKSTKRTTTTGVAEKGIRRRMICNTRIFAYSPWGIRHGFWWFNRFLCLQHNPVRIFWKSPCLGLLSWLFCAFSSSVEIVNC